MLTSAASLASNPCSSFASSYVMEEKGIQATLLRVVVGITLMYLSSQICFLIGPVPISLQTLGAMLIGFYYRPIDAAWSVGSFLCLGAMGLPIFSAHRFGILHLLGPTGGYLFGFSIAAVVVSFLRERFSVQRWPGLLLLNGIGGLSIYGFGLLWLTTRFMGFNQALQVGLFPFMLPALVKALFLTTIVARYPLEPQVKKTLSSEK